MQYRIQHVTCFDYSQPIRESVMELRMQPRTDAVQRCLEFELDIAPEAVPHRYTDFLQNTVHHFDIPGQHQHLKVTATALVEIENVPGSRNSSASAWAELDALKDSAEYWDWLHPSHFAHPSDLLNAFAEKHHIGRRHDPLSDLKHLQDAIANGLVYQRGITRADSPIDECLKNNSGVCQDFAHIFIALARGMGVPCYYVSGYLFQSANGGPQIAEASTHAWAEGFVPRIGWVGFDPANRALAGEDHVRVAIGRDYQDVPPTRGTFKGLADTKLDVRVFVAKA